MRINQQKMPRNGKTRPKHGTQHTTRYGRNKHTTREFSRLMTVEARLCRPPSWPIRLSAINTYYKDHFRHTINQTIVLLEIYHLYLYRVYLLVLEYTH